MNDFLLITAIVLHLGGVAAVGGSGLGIYIMLGKIEHLLPADKTADERYELIAEAEVARKKMLPFVILAFVSWEILVIINFFRRWGSK